MDAVAVENGRLVLIEAKVFKIVDGLSKLPTYKTLVPSTPELSPYHGLPIIMRLVAPWTSETMEVMAKGLGVEIVVFNPDWIRDYVQQYHNYWQREYREAREEKMRLRRALGVE